MTNTRPIHPDFQFSLDLAIEAAYEIEKMESKSARWIAKDAIRELTGEKVRISDYPRSIYRR